SLEQPLTIAGVPCYILAAEAAGVIVELDAITAVGKLDRERADMTAAPLHGKCHVASRDSRKQRQGPRNQRGDGGRAPRPRGGKHSCPWMAAAIDLSTRLSTSAKGTLSSWQ